MDINKHPIKNISLLSLVLVGGMVYQNSTSESNQRIPIPVQEKFSQVVSNSKQALPSGEKLMVYISCNVSTLARDLVQLVKIYEVNYIQSVDMFPHTARTEAVVKLVKRKQNSCSKK